MSLAKSEPQQKAIELLLSGERIGKVATKVGVNRSTIWQWRQEPRFSWVLDTAREMALGAALERLHSLAPEAVDILHQGVRMGSETSAMRLLRLIRIDRLQKKSDDPRPLMIPSLLTDDAYAESCPEELV